MDIRPSLADSGRVLLPFIFVMIVFGVFIWMSKPEPNLHCTFSAERNQTQLRLGTLTAPLHTMTVEGYLERPFGDSLFDLKGAARLTIDGATRPAEVHGSVFLDKARRSVTGLALFVENSQAFGRSHLNVYTLNEEGRLDSDPAKAFAFTSKAFQFAHPLDYSCEIAGELPKSEDKDQ